MTGAIDFYFEFASPYGYFAALRVESIASRQGRSVRWRPFMLGAIMKTTGAQPLPHTPLRNTYFFHDVRRLGRRRGIEITFAETMPMNGLAAARAFYWLAEDVANVAVPLGIAATDLVAAVQRPDIKQRLKGATEEAENRGVCGSPFIFVDDEPFFGQDRLDEVEQWIETGGW